MERALIGAVADVLLLILVAVPLLRRIRPRKGAVKKKPGRVFLSEKEKGIVC